MRFAGQQLSHYHLIRLIGQGGMGEIYLAKDTRISRQVAIKVIQTERQPYRDDEASQQSEKSFEREMDAISRLDHPQILSFYDFGKEQIANSFIIYMVMPYRPEGSLADWLIQHGTDLLAPQDVGHMIGQAASALQHAHDHDVIHRDVKPSNFLVRINIDHPTYPDLFLVDFGIARVISANSLGSNSIRGTYSCMAPEQWSGEAVPASDQYALAIMSYLLLTGQIPFHGQLEHVMFQHLTVSPKPPSELNSHLSPAVDDVILRALAKKSNERFPTIKAFAISLQQALDYTELHTTLTISKSKALQGGNQTITLPGKLPVTVTVTIPPNVQHGQILHLPDQGTSYYRGGPRGPLQLTLHIDQNKDTPYIVNGNTKDLSQAANSRDSAKQSPTATDTNIPQPHVDKPTSISSTASTSPQPSEARNKLPKWQYITLLVTLALLLIVSSVIGVALFNNNIVASNSRIAGTTQSIAHYNAASTALVRKTKATTTTQVTNMTATAIVANPNLDPYQPSGTLQLTDPLSQPQAWKDLSNTTWGGQCQFVNGTYQISQSQPNKNFICNEHTQYSNFAAEVKMTISRGDCGGLTIRDDSASSKFYLFRVCQDGTYSFAKYISNSSSNATLLRNGTSSAIKKGIDQLNIIAVVAHNSHFDLYVNHQKIDEASDSTYSQGSIGLVADAPNNPTTVIYQDARMWAIG